VVHMMFRRSAVALMALGLGLMLGSCTQVSGVVADYWPHWAGGEPNGMPPRPGAPGYDVYVQHRQQDIDAAKPKVTPVPSVDGGLY